MKEILGLLILGSPFILALVFLFINMITVTDDYDPNAKHYCAWCGKLEWKCNCPDC